MGVQEKARETDSLRKTLRDLKKFSTKEECDRSSNVVAQAIGELAPARQDRHGFLRPAYEALRDGSVAFNGDSGRIGRVSHKEKLIRRFKAISPTIALLQKSGRTMTERGVAGRRRYLSCEAFPSN